MAINSMFLTPAVTPWNTTLPGVGPNNPAIRLYEYNKDNFAIKDIKQYFLDLSQSGTPTWKMEYSATAGYGIPDVTTASLQGLVDSFWDQTSDKFDKYYLYNSVSYDKKKCDSVCRKVQLCAITNVDFDDYAVCISEYTSGVQRYTGSALTYMVILICLNVIMHSYIL
uniref:Acid sphingomyelinase-like phosphodiesterase 3b-like n=1 Tax=Saccoglossus kowalevskii TaxID=10224 RepID=A0ABM0MAT4_SACKO